MNIGLIDVDGHNFPNLALMKLAAWHKKRGDTVEWYDIFGDYDRVYMSKVFTHTPDFGQVILNAREIVKGGTGYDIESCLPDEVDRTMPDYSIYPFIDRKTAYGFLTRGCIRKCPWCIVPKKEGMICRYMDVDDIAVEGRTNLVLMDNNFLAAGDYALEQLDKIAERGYTIDFNQALDARLVTDEMADRLARVKWSRYIRFGCDTSAQIEPCYVAIEKIIERGYTKEFSLYTLLHGDIRECYERISYWRGVFNWRVKCFAQPELNFKKHRQDIPQWQKDMAQWACKMPLYKAIDFKDFEPRKGFKCSEYFE